MRNAQEEELATLRVQAEDAIARGKPPQEVRELLEKMVRQATPKTDDATFANRHLAELLLDENPWRAALYLRRVRTWGQADDVVEALLGLCHALLGNFHCAVFAYQRALRASPRNPWHHHNVGHLLDVALSHPRRALHHLRLAQRLEPDEHEIAASLAHCLARVGALDEAESTAQEALRLAPKHPAHEALLVWIQEGAMEESAPRRQVGAGRGFSGDAVGGTADRSLDEPEGAGGVEAALVQGMGAAGFPDAMVGAAQALWSDFRRGRRLRVLKPGCYAAAVEYAIASLQGSPDATQASIARRYGVHPRSVSARYAQIRSALALEPGDPRYCVLTHG